MPSNNDDPDPAGDELSPWETQWLDTEREAYLALERGEFTEAIVGWTELLDDDQAVEFFRSEEDGQLLNEVAAGLVTAHLGSGNTEEAARVADQWQVSPTGYTDDA